MLKSAGLLEEFLLRFSTIDMLDSNEISAESKAASTPSIICLQVQGCKVEVIRDKSEDEDEDEDKDEDEDEDDNEGAEDSDESGVNMEV